MFDEEISVDNPINESSNDDNNKIDVKPIKAIKKTSNEEEENVSDLKISCII